MVEPGENIVVGVSGGVDSVVLLHILKQISNEIPLNLIVAHFNHCLRGEESDGDEQFVQQLAKKFNLQFKSERGDVRHLVEKEKMSVEMAARRLRHLFLAKTAKESGAKKVALAHHCDDQIELFFLRLLRGCGSAGLSGMRPVSPSPVDSEILLIRPFLKIWKRELLNYAQEKYLDYREDSTNATGEYIRNKIRNELIPLLKLEYQHSLEKIILREMEILDAERDYISTQAQEWLASKSVPFSRLHIAIQRKAIQLQLIKLGIEPEFDLVEKLRLKPDEPVSVSPEDLILIDRNGEVKRINYQKHLFDSKALEVNLQGEQGVIDCDGVEIKWNVFPMTSKKEELLSNKPSNIEYFDFDRVGRNIVLRNWREGDRFKPIGLNNEVKLQDLFVNNKIPRDKRHSIVVAEDKNGRLFWVESLRISEDHKITDRTQFVLKWEWKRRLANTGLH